MPDDDLTSWLAMLKAVRGWTVYRCGEVPPPPLVAVSHRHYFTDVVIIRDAEHAVAYRTLLAVDETPPDAGDALWTFSGDAVSTLNAIFALSRPRLGVQRPRNSPSYQLPPGELREFTAPDGNP